MIGIKLIKRMNKIPDVNPTKNKRVVTIAPASKRSSSMAQTTVK